jgi:hypothetical protein
MIKANRRRSGRAELRVKKRRPKQYPQMTAPRSVLRIRLLEHIVAAQLRAIHACPVFLHLLVPRKPL